MKLHRILIECDLCKCGEIAECADDFVRGSDAAMEWTMGYQRGRIDMSNGWYAPLLCPRCQNRAGEADLLCLAIKHVVRWGDVEANDLASKFPRHSVGEVDAAACGLLTAEVIAVDERGIVRLRKGF